MEIKREELGLSVRLEVDRMKYTLHQYLSNYMTNLDKVVDEAINSDEFQKEIVQAIKTEAKSMILHQLETSLRLRVERELAQSLKVQKEIGKAIEKHKDQISEIVLSSMKKNLHLTNF